MLWSLLYILLVATALEASNQRNYRATKVSRPQRNLSNTHYVQRENQILNSVNATRANATRANATRANATRANATRANATRANATTAMKSEVAKANDVIIQQEHNLLGVTMSIVTRLMEIKSLTLSDLSWEMLSRLFAAVMSVIFGPNTNILWPGFVHIAVPFLKLLTT